MYCYRRLKDLREDADLNQKNIADILGITQQQYSLYETGEREIPFHLVIILADYYHVSLDYIADRNDSSPPKKH
jgi:transcriptional regulator with XRE-family HTH domain